MARAGPPGQVVAYGLAVLLPVRDGWCVDYIFDCGLISQSFKKRRGDTNGPLVKVFQEQPLVAPQLKHL